MLYKYGSARVNSWGVFIFYFNLVSYILNKTIIPPELAGYTMIFKELVHA